jgi:hypothetical protein
MLKPVLEGVRDVELIHYPSCTDSIKPTLQFSRNFAVLMLPGDHFFPDICIRAFFVQQYINVFVTIVSPQPLIGP